MRARLRLRTVLLAVNLAVLALPLLAVRALHLYDSDLIRATESELDAQAAFVEAAYRQALASELARAGRQGYGHPVDRRFAAAAPPGEPYRPIAPRLDLAAEAIRPRAEEARPAPAAADAAAEAAGAAVMPLLQQAKLVTLAGMRIVDPDGVVVASSATPGPGKSDADELGQSLAHREEVARALYGEHVSLLRVRVSDSPRPPLQAISRSAGVRVFVARPVVDGGQVQGAVILSRTPVDISKALYDRRVPLAGGAAALLALVLLVSIGTSIFISRPVRALIVQTRRVAAGDRTAAAPLAHPGTHEIAELSEAFARMERTLQERSDYIRTFAAAVSHEFKTPLTSIRGAVELLRDHGDAMSAAERERFLGNLDEDAARLNRLVGRLLDLARADVFVPGDERTPLRPALERVVHQQREAGLDVALRAAGDLGSVRMAAETLESVLGNLLDNARQHGGAGVHVSVAAEASEAGARVEVRDDGPGVSAANAARVFDPFFTTARARGGTGLGLSVVRSLVIAHGGSIELLPADRGFAVRVTLPAGA